MGEICVLSRCTITNLFRLVLIFQSFSKLLICWIWWISLLLWYQWWWSAICHRHIWCSLSVVASVVGHLGARCKGWDIKLQFIKKKIYWRKHVNYMVYVLFENKFIVKCYPQYFSFMYSIQWYVAIGNIYWDFFLFIWFNNIISFICI